MLLSFLASSLLFAVVSLGLGWPIVARASFTAAEKLVASMSLSVLAAFLWAWLVFVFLLPAEFMWCLPMFGVAGIAVRRREFGAMCRDPLAQAIMGAQVLVTAWCLGWLATVESYSGGGWAADWIEHWQRARFFLEHEPLNTQFVTLYSLTARPPLANVVTAALLALTRADFAHFQLFSVLLASLAFAPAALFALRWDNRRAVWLLAAFAAANPLFVQNATFTWTKLPAAFFILTSLYFFLRATDENFAPRAALLSAVCIAAGVLAHYSAGPYFIMLVFGWITLGWKRRTEPAWWRTSAFTAVVATIVLATWFAWAIATYGVGGTFLTNTSVTAAHPNEENQLVKISFNLFDTLVPHFLRPIDPSLIAQRSPWGALRDWCFQCYQVNLPLAFGSIAWLAIVREMIRAGRDASARIRFFWATFIAGTIVLGTAVHGARDHWGLAHICLQPLVLLGLAFLATRWSKLARGWRLALIAGGTLDVALGIALHFGLESFWIDRWLTPARKPVEIAASYNANALMNLGAKVFNRLEFFSDALAVPFAFVLALLTAILLLILLRARAPASRA